MRMRHQAALAIASCDDSSMRQLVLIQLDETNQQHVSFWCLNYVLEQC